MKDKKDEIIIEDTKKDSVTNTNISPEKVNEIIENKKSKRGRPKKEDKILKEKQKEIENLQKVTEQANDIIPMFGTIYNEIIDGKIHETDLKHIFKLSDKQLENIRKTFIPLANKYNWLIGDSMPELMFGLSIGSIAFEKFTLFKEYKKLKLSEPENELV